MTKIKTKKEAIELVKKGTLAIYCNSKAEAENCSKTIPYNIGRFYSKHNCYMVTIGNIIFFNKKEIAQLRSESITAKRFLAFPSEEVKPKSIIGGWCVKNFDKSKDFVAVMKFTFKKLGLKMFDFADSEMYYGVQSNGLPYLSSCSIPNYLTLSELKELIGYKAEPKVTEPTPEQREIVGYVSPMDCKELDIEKGDVFTKRMGGYACGSYPKVYLTEQTVKHWQPYYAKIEAEIQAELFDEIGMNSMHLTPENFRAWMKDTFETIKRK